MIHGLNESPNNFEAKELEKFMRFQRKHRVAFSIIEMMTAVIILSIVALFAIPSYTKAVNRSKERDAVSNLDLIREGVRLYRSRNDGAVPGALPDVASINATFFLNIVEQQGNAYACTTANIYTCTAVNTDGWTAGFRLNNSFGVIYCMAGACPSL
jgi:type II secretory pathway pseudopilin PulG